MSKFSTRVKELRLQHSLTQSQLGAIVHLHQATVKDWEVLGKEPSFDTVIALAKHFGVTTDYLLGATDDEN